MFLRFVQFKNISQNDIKSHQKSVLKNDVKMMTKNIEKWSKNGGKIQKNDLQKSMSKIDAKKCEKGTTQAESGTFAVDPPGHTNQQDKLCKLNKLNIYKKKIIGGTLKGRNAKEEF